jgi:peptide deformylase
MKQFVKYNRGVSAIQFGAPLCIIAVKHNGEVIVMINPEIIERRGCVSMRETCLSCPGIREVVERPTDVTVTYFTEDAVFAEKKFTLPTARVIAHEMEHLDGITLYDRRTV